MTDFSSVKIAIVLLPGMDSSGTLFAGFVAALGISTDAVIVSYPADRQLGYLELEQFARAHLPVDHRFVILGESFSGPVAIALAAASPPGLLGLILCCTFARNPVPLLRPLKPFIGLLPVFPRLSRLLSPVLFGGYTSPELRRALNLAITSVPAPILRHRLHAVLSVDEVAALKRVQVPILYLQADADQIVTKAAFALIRSLQPTVELAVLPGPHILLQTNPVGAARVVTRFIRSVPMSVVTASEISK